MAAIEPAGVPLITQLRVLIESPAGSAGATVQFVIAAPLLFSVVGLTLMAIPTVPLVPKAPAKLTVGTPALIVSVTLAALLAPAEL